VTSTSARVIDYRRKDVFGACDHFKFLEISDVITETVQVNIYCKWRLLWILCSLSNGTNTN